MYICMCLVGQVPSRRESRPRDSPGQKFVPGFLLQAIVKYYCYLSYGQMTRGSENAARQRGESTSTRSCDVGVHILGCSPSKLLQPCDGAVGPLRGMPLHAPCFSIIPVVVGIVASSLTFAVDHRSNQDSGRYSEIAVRVPNEEAMLLEHLADQVSANASSVRDIFVDTGCLLKHKQCSTCPQGVPDVIRLVQNLNGAS
jgi:hypothetical protein